MCDRSKKLKRQAKAWGLTAGEIAKHSGRSIDTIRKLGLINLADGTLNDIEKGIEAARQEKLESLQQKVS